MKPEELQIGDWVDFYHPHEPEKGIVTRHRVTEIYECGLVGIDNHFNPVHASHLEPIKITPEILELNGFKKDERNEKMYTWNWGVIDDCISYDKETGIVRIFYVSGLAFKKILMYVHQLQQAMRLCEINKEIIVEGKE